LMLVACCLMLVSVALAFALPYFIDIFVSYIFAHIVATTCLVLGSWFLVLDSLVDSLA